MIPKGKLVTLGDISSRIGDGIHGTPKYDSEGEYYFVNGNNLEDGKVIIKTETKRISKNEFERIKRPLGNQTIMVAINGTLGNIGFYNGEKIALGKSACYINLKENIDKYFIRYVLEHKHFQKYAYLFATGATIKNLGLKAIRKYPINLPPLPTQRKIAAILSAYDDLIENNLKRIKLLEEKAQLTYEEWFVRMRFPGHETTPIDEETGLPEGWEKVKCFDVMEVLSGGTPKTSIDLYWNGPIQFYTPKDAVSSSYTNGTEKTITELGLSKCNSKLYPKDTVFITARGTVGKVNLAAEPMAMNQSCYALRSKESTNQLFLFDAIRNIVGSFKSAASGGVFDTIIVDTFKFLPMILPSKQLVSKYQSEVNPIYSNSLTLQRQNQLLKEARDILLPRLMTGMIDVEKLQLSEHDF